MALTVEPNSNEANGNEVERLEDRKKRRLLYYYQRRLKEVREGSERGWGCGRTRVFEEFVEERQGSATFFPTGKLMEGRGTGDLALGSANKILGEDILKTSISPQPLDVLDIR